MLNQDSLKKRYAYKLSTNLIGLGISLIIGGIVPRGLGPKYYGDYNFLTNFFSQFVGFFDMGTSTCFYTKLSQRPKDSGLVSFYLYFIILVSIVTFSFVYISNFLNIQGSLWPELSMPSETIMLFVYLAALWGILEWVSRIFNQMADAYGLTVSAEKTKVLQKFIGVLIILLLFYSHQLFLINYFYYQYFILFFIIIVLTLIIKKSGYSIRRNVLLNRNQFKSYAKEFWDYSSPLLVLSLFGLVIGIFDRWLLQIYGGSVEQGLFGLSFQISAICFLFTTAMTPLLLREFSIAYSNKDLPKMTVLFRRYIPVLYSIAAYFACFIALQADKVAVLFGGNNFKEASLSLVIMAFYPIHQTYGQLSGSVFYATGQTKLYRNISIIFGFIGIPLLYFLIAPSEKLGLNYGAVGLAIKMVLLQFIAVNVALYYNTKLLRITFWKYLGHQLIVLLPLLFFAYVSICFFDILLNLKAELIVSFLLSGFLYSILVGLTVYFVPILFGLSKEDIRAIINQGWIKLKNILKK